RADRPVYSETEYPRRAFGWSPLVSWRADRFLYVRAPRRELYDLVSDPAAARSIVDARSRVAAGLDAELRRFLTAAGGSGVESSDAKHQGAGAPSVDPALAQRLAALGYISGSGGSPVPSGVDPKDRIDVANALHDAVLAVEDGLFQKAIPLLERVI